MHAHQHNDGSRRLGCQVQVGGELARFRGSGNDPETFRHAPRSQRNSGRCRNGITAGEARYHLGVDTVLTGKFDFFETPAKHKRVAPFEPHHMAILLGIMHDEGVDVFLHAGVGPPPFSHVHLQGIGAAVVQQVGVHQCVVHDHIGLLQCLNAFYRDQVRVTGTGPYESEFHL